jgi:hypothetical protein
VDAIAKVCDDVRREPSPGVGVIGPAAGGGVLVAGKVTAGWVEVGATRHLLQQQVPWDGLCRSMSSESKRNRDAISDSDNGDVTVVTVVATAASEGGGSAASIQLSVLIKTTIAIHQNAVAGGKISMIKLVHIIPHHYLSRGDVQNSRGGSKWASRGSRAVGGAK